METRLFKMVYEAMIIIDNLGLSDFVSGFEDKETGFMFTAREELRIISDALDFQLHSGASFTYVLRTCQYYYNNINEWRNECERHADIIQQISSTQKTDTVIEEDEEEHEEEHEEEEVVIKNEDNKICEDSLHMNTVYYSNMNAVSKIDYNN